MSEPTAFPLDESKLPFKIPKDTKPREKIMKLGQMITDRVPAKLRRLTVEDPEYWGLASIVTDEMADVALKMKVRQPMTLPELEKATGKPAKELELLLYQMSCVGLLEYNWENPRREKQYILPMFVPGSAEFFNMNKQQIADHPEVTAFFERMTFLPLEHITAMVPPGGAGIGMHVIPVEKAIETENHSLDIEHISHWLKKYQGKYAAGPCSCRMSRAAMGEGCGDDPDDWCIGVGDMADYLVETNKGHYVTYDEVMRILQKAEDNGFVHQITNIDGENKIFAICNCNVNVCNALRTSQLFNTPNMSRSAYVAKVEPQNCVACGRCVEFCPAGAVKLGQKLCTKSGPVEYPRQELPDAVKWGPEKWAVDYRDKNRVNCYDTGTAPCKTACPAHIAVQGYLKLAAQGKYREALQLIKRENPFPAVCGRICNRRCEDACTRGTVDQAVAIDEVKRFIAQQDLDAATRFVPEKVIPKVDGEFDQQIAIIGGGPTGIAAAYFLARAGIETTIFERENCLGGVPRHVIPSFRIANETIEKDIALMEKYGVDVRCGAPAPSVTELKAMGYTHILFAVGAWKPGKLEIAGDVAGAIQWMKGVKAGNIAVGGSIAVVGGGNTAMDAARLAKRSGAKQVTLVYRRTRKYMPADEHELALALQDGVTFAELAAPVKQADGMLTCERMVLGQADASGRRSPVGSGEFFDIPCDLVISAVGEQVDSALMAANGIEVDKKGRPAFQTNLPGVYAAGDAARGPATVVEGIADAARFAQEVIGTAYTYDIPQQAYITKTDAQAKKGVLQMSGCICREGDRCLQCSTVCENCVDSCPNRANVVIAMADGSHQILHVDKMCNECGNCTQFCPYASEPCHDKFTLFQTAEDMEDSHNAGVLFLEGGKVRVRLAGAPQEYNLDEANDLPRELETFILTIRDQYGYLFA